MIGALKFLVGMVGIFWLAAVGAYAMYQWDRRPPHTPAVHVLFWHWEAPESLKAQLGDYVLAEAKATARAKAVEAESTLITAQAEANVTAALAHTHTITRTIIKEVPLVITPAIDRGYPLSVGFVRVLDASALGRDVSAVPGTAGLADDATSPVKSSLAATIIAGNNGEHRSCIVQVTGLQDWITAQRATFNKGTTP